MEKSDGWVMIAPGIYKPGPELSARIRKRVVSVEEIKSFIRQFSESQEEAEKMIKEMYPD